MNKRIAIVDYDRNTRISVADRLKEIPDVLVVQLASYADLVSLIEEGFHFTVVILDGKISASSMDGPACTHWIKQKTQSTKVIGYTIYATLKERFLANGADSFLVKSGNLKPLVSAVKTLLAA